MGKITVEDISKTASDLLAELEQQGFADIPIFVSREGDWSKDYAKFTLDPDYGRQRYFDSEDFLDDLIDHISEYFFTDNEDIHFEWFPDDGAGEVVEVRRIAPPHDNVIRL